MDTHTVTSTWTHIHVSYIQCTGSCTNTDTINTHACTRLRNLTNIRKLRFTAVSDVMFSIFLHQYSPHFHTSPPLSLSLSFFYHLTRLQLCSSEPQRQILPGSTKDTCASKERQRQDRWVGNGDRQYLFEAPFRSSPPILSVVLSYIGSSGHAVNLPAPYPQIIMLKLL